MSAPSGTWGSVDLGGTVGVLHAGARLRVAHWPGEPDGPGTIILVHGRAEFIEVYGETVSDFCHRGFAVITYDHRGQGGSQRRVRRGGHIGSYRDYVDDLLAVVRYARQIGMPRPYTVVAHSMGGLVALTALPRLAGEVDRAVLLAPALQIAGLPAPEPVVGLWAGLSKALGLGHVRARKDLGDTRPFPGNRITSDEVRYANLTELTEANPDLVTGPPSIGWVGATIAAGARMRRRVGAPLAIPTLFIASGADAIVATPAIDRFARSAPGGGAILIPGARHHVLLERNGLRDLAFAAMDAFILGAERDTAAPASSRPMRPLRFEPAPATALTGSPPPIPPGTRPPPQTHPSRPLAQPAQVATAQDDAGGATLAETTGQTPVSAKPAPSKTDQRAPEAASAPSDQAGTASGHAGTAVAPNGVPSGTAPKPRSSDEPPAHPTPTTATTAAREPVTPPIATTPASAAADDKAANTQPIRAATPSPSSQSGAPEAGDGAAPPRAQAGRSVATDPQAAAQRSEPRRSLPSQPTAAAPGGGEPAELDSGTIAPRSERLRNRIRARRNKLADTDAAPASPKTATPQTPTPQPGTAKPERASSAAPPQAADKVRPPADAPRHAPGAEAPPNADAKPTPQPANDPLTERRRAAARAQRRAQRRGAPHATASGPTPGHSDPAARPQPTPTLSAAMTQPAPAPQPPAIPAEPPANASADTTVGTALDAEVPLDAAAPVGGGMFTTDSPPIPVRELNGDTHALATDWLSSAQPTAGVDGSTMWVALPERTLAPMSEGGSPDNDPSVTEPHTEAEAEISAEPDSPRPAGATPPPLSAPDSAGRLRSGRRRERGGLRIPRRR